MAVEDCAVAEEFEEGEGDADLVADDGVELGAVADHPEGADQGAQVGQHRQEPVEDAPWDQVEETPSHHNRNGSVMGLGEGVVVVGRVDDRLMTVPYQ